MDEESSPRPRWANTRGSGARTERRRVPRLECRSAVRSIRDLVENLFFHELAKDDLTGDLVKNDLVRDLVKGHT